MHAAAFILQYQIKAVIQNAEKLHLIMLHARTLSVHVVRISATLFPVLQTLHVHL